MKKNLFRFIAISILLSLLTLGIVFAQTINEDLFINGKLTVRDNLDMTWKNKRLFLGWVGGSTFWLSYSPKYPNYGIFYTESSPDFVSISPNWNAKDWSLNVYGNGNIKIKGNIISDGDICIWKCN